jgi:hypothetical protein
MLNPGRWAMVSRAVVAALVAVWAASRPAAAAGPSVHDGYQAPRFTVPFVSTPPQINGAIDDAAWSHALSVDALQTTEGAVSVRPTRLWMCWDADHLYLAMRSPLRPGERLLRANRQLGRDNVKVVFDDAYEIFLNAGTHSPDGEPVFFQYLGNVAGGKYDVMFEPAVGNSRPGWESGWHPVNRVTPDGRFWEMTVAIPRASLYQNQPFKSGQVIHGLFVRDFKRPWEQNNLGGSGSFSVPETHCAFALSDSAPAIHLRSVADPAAGTFGVSLDADAPFAWSFDSDGGVHKSGTLPIDDLHLDTPGDGYYRIRVTGDDGRTVLLDWCSRRAFGDRSALTTPTHDAGDVAVLNLTFNPVQNYVRVEGDFINYDDRARIARYAAAVVDSAGKTVAEQDLQSDDLAYVHGLLRLGEGPAGRYVARLVCTDAAGHELLRKQTPFERKDLATEYPWWHTAVGRIDRVIAPWTPLKHDGPKVDVWGRSMAIGTAGLPSQVTTQGMELLAGPATLSGEAGDGKPLVAAAGTMSSDAMADYAYAVKTAGSLGDDVAVSALTTTEFDGLCKVQLTLTPKRPTAVRSLKVIVPMKPEFADYCHACGEGIRYGFSYGYLPKGKTGPLWTSKQVDGQPMLVGSFIPHVWVGNDKGGLCWMADGDQGWTPNDAVPAIEVRRDDPNHVDLVLNLISSATTLDAPRTITFAFQATPVKPPAPGWRMNTWSTADSFVDFCRVEPKGGHLIWNALPFTLDPADSRRMVEQRQSSTMAYQWGPAGAAYHANAVPYFENNGIDPKFAPAAGYFADEWHARVSDSTAFCDSYTDFIVWNLDRWCKQTGMDGWYVDNVRPVACDNVDAGRGYRLPDGRVQPTYQMFATREQFLRVRAMFQDNGKTGKFVLHMTNHMIMPWIGAADLALDGEDHVTFPDMHKDFADFWSPARLRLDYAAPQGTPVTFLQEYQGNWASPDLDRAMRAYTAMTIVNDILPGANPNGRNNAVWSGRARFGIDAADVRFVPYWTPDNGVTVTGGPALYAASWRRPGRALIAIANGGPADAVVTLKLDPAKLGVSADDLAHAVDADTGESVSASIPVPRHDYRQVMVGR